MNCIGCLMLCSMKQQHDNKKVILKEEPKKKMSFSIRDSIAVSSDYSELKYWFSEFIKYVIVDYNNYGNKEELLETVWKYIDIIEVSKYYDMYKSKYSGEYSEKNMLEFCNFVKNTDFKKRIVSIVYIYIVCIG